MRPIINCRMHVCICHNLNTAAVERAIADGASSVEEVSEKLGLGSKCGTCIPFAREMIESIVSRLVRVA